jgi:hypothetical protein
MWVDEEEWLKFMKWSCASLHREQTVAITFKIALRHSSSSGESIASDMLLVPLLALGTCVDEVLALTASGST